MLHIMIFAKYYLYGFNMDFSLIILLGISYHTTLCYAFPSTLNKCDV